MGMFIVGDSVEREIDGAWFLGEVKAVAPPGRDGEILYTIFYNDIGNVEENVLESELRLAETSMKENDVANERPTGFVVQTNTDEGKNGAESDGRVTYHKEGTDKNTRLQSTGTAYVIHGDSTQRAKAGGSGLRAIRALK